VQSGKLPQRALKTLTLQSVGRLNPNQSDHRVFGVAGARPENGAIPQNDPGVFEAPNPQPDRPFRQSGLGRKRSVPGPRIRFQHGDDNAIMVINRSPDRQSTPHLYSL
jgi:hypothetical protein